MPPVDRAKNCEALRITFNVLSAMINEQKGGIYADSLTLSLAQKMVYERFEKEKNLMINSMPIDEMLKYYTESGFNAHDDIPNRDSAASTVQNSHFYKSLFTKNVGSR